MTLAHAQLGSAPSGAFQVARDYAAGASLTGGGAGCRLRLLRPPRACALRIRPSDILTPHRGAIRAV